MLDRYNNIKEHIPKLDVEGLVPPSYREGKEIETLSEDLKKPDRVTKSLQLESTTLADVRCLFDSVLAHCLETESRLSPNADIV